MKRKIFYTLVNNGINAVFPIVIIPVATQKLTAEAFGHAAFMLTIYTTAVALTQIGFDTYGLRELGKAKADRPKSNAVYSELVVGHGVVITFVAAVMVALKVAGLLDAPGWTLGLMALALYASALQTDWALFAFGEFGYIALRNLFVKTGTIVALLLVLQNGDPGTTYLTIVLASYILSSALTFRLASRALSLTWVTAAALQVRLRAIRPFILSRVMSAILQNVDILVVGWMCQLEEAAVYFIARKVTQAGSQTFSHIAIVFNNALYSTALGATAGVRDPLAGLDVSMLFSLLAASVISFNGSAIMELLSGNGYLIEPGLLSLLSVMIVANAFTNHIGLNVLYFFGKEFDVAKSMSISAAFFSVTIVALTGLFGINGAAASIVASNLLLAALQVQFGRGLVPDFLPRLGVILAWPALIVLSVIGAFYSTARLGISFTSLNPQMVLCNLAIVASGILAFFVRRGP